MLIPARKQREIDADTQFSISCSGTLEPAPHGTVPPHSGRVISAQVTIPGITLTDTAKGVPHRRPSGIKPGKLTIVIGYDSYKMNLDNHRD